MDGTQRLVETLAALEKSLGKLRTETAKLRAETNDGLSGIGKKVERLESITGELPAYKSMSSGSGREMYGGSGGGGAGFGMAQMIPSADRWAIVAYLRALQLSQDVPVARLPEPDRARLEAAR